MDKKQLVTNVIIPTLKVIPKGYSAEALMAVEMIFAHESRRGHFLKQVNGPALGLLNMEPTTYHSTWKHGDSIWNNAVLIGIITEEEKEAGIYPPPEQLLYDLVLNVFMTRQRLFMKPKKLPRDPMAMTKYLKLFWNSTNGAANPDSYYIDWVFWK